MVLQIWFLWFQMWWFLWFQIWFLYESSWFLWFANQCQCVHIDLKYKYYVYLFCSLEKRLISSDFICKKSHFYFVNVKFLHKSSNTAQKSSKKSPAYRPAKKPQEPKTIGTNSNRLKTIGTSSYGFIAPKGLFVQGGVKKSMFVRPSVRACLRVSVRHARCQKSANFWQESADLWQR